MWSIAILTVKSNRSSLKVGIDMSDKIGLSGLYEHISTLSQCDYCGYETDIHTLLFSRKSGRYSTHYTQYDTIIILTPAFSNQVRAYTQSNRLTLAIQDAVGYTSIWEKMPAVHSDSTDFNNSLKFRMGQLWEPNQASIHPVVG